MLELKKTKDRHKVEVFSNDKSFKKIKEYIFYGSLSELLNQVETQNPVYITAYLEK